MRGATDVMQRRGQRRIPAGLSAALLTLVVIASSCGPSLRGCKQPGIVCVGLVTGYGSVRSGIEKQAWLALQDSKAAGTITRIDFIETNDTRDRTPNIAYFVDSDFDIVVTTGAGIL
ncbi:MAG TPA: hypothetical protein VFH29_04205, partial [Anaerolineales bacterium]|nr:hypothetical protein [Anaerolineales bacterium]